MLRWVSPEVNWDQLRGLILPGDTKLANDTSGDAVLLFPSDWTFRYFASNNPKLALLEVPFGQGPPNGQPTMRPREAMSSK